ncbi:MAG: histidine phosphatase family protein [Aeromonas veronii]
MKKYFTIAFVSMALLTSNLSFAKDPIVNIYAVRHGKTMLNTTDRVQGWADAVLTPAGIEVTEQLGHGLQDIKFVAAYSSDSGRAIQTANIILSASKQKLALKTDWRFREFSFGTYEGDLNHTMWNDLAKLENKTMEEWFKGFTPAKFADGVAKLDKGRDKKGVNWPAENYAMVTKRLKEGMADLVNEVQKQGGGNVLLVSHGLSITSMVDILVPTEILPKGPLGNASVTKLRYENGKYQAESIGDMSYVEKGKK